MTDNGLEDYFEIVETMARTGVIAPESASQCVRFCTHFCGQFGLAAPFFDRSGLAAMAVWHSSTWSLRLTFSIDIVRWQILDYPRNHFESGEIHPLEGLPTLLVSMLYLFKANKA